MPFLSSNQQCQSTGITYILHICTIVWQQLYIHVKHVYNSRFFIILNFIIFRNELIRPARQTAGKKPRPSHAHTWTGRRQKTISILHKAKTLFPDLTSLVRRDIFKQNNSASHAKMTNTAHSVRRRSYAGPSIRLIFTVMKYAARKSSSTATRKTTANNRQTKIIINSSPITELWLSYLYVSIYIFYLCTHFALRKGKVDHAPQESVDGCSSPSWVHR